MEKKKKAFYVSLKQMNTKLKDLELKKLDNEDAKALSLRTTIETYIIGMVIESVKLKKRIKTLENKFKQYESTIATLCAKIESDDAGNNPDEDAKPKREKSKWDYSGSAVSIKEEKEKPEFKKIDVLDLRSCANCKWSKWNCESTVECLDYSVWGFDGMKTKDRFKEERGL